MEIVLYLFYIVWFLISNISSLLLPALVIIFFVLWRKAKKKNIEKTKIIDQMYENYSANDYGLSQNKETDLVSDKIPENNQTTSEEETQSSTNNQETEDLKNIEKDDNLSKNVKYATEVAKSEDEIIAEEEAKRKRNLFNINLALYISSFLIVAAVSIFLTTNTQVSSVAKLVIILISTISFYVVGLIVYKKSSRLKQAAVAFTSTGLATVPFIGLAFNQYLATNSPVSWLITSVVGLVAYVIAALIIQNQILSYLSVGFVISTVLSATATSNAPLITYFTVMIFFGTAMSILAIYGTKKLPRVFILPVINTNEWIVPLTLFASILSFNSLRLNDYIVLLFLGSFYYLAIGISSLERRMVAYFISRSMLIIGLLISSYSISHDLRLVSVVLAGIGVLNVLSSTALMSFKNSFSEYLQSEFWLIVGLFMQTFSPLVLAYVSQGSFILPNIDMQILKDRSLMLIAVLELSVLVITSLASSIITKLKSYSYFATFGLILLPYLIGYFLFNPALDDSRISVIYLTLSFVVLGVRIGFSKKIADEISRLLNFNYIIFLFEALFFAIRIDHNSGIVIWLSAIFSWIVLTIFEKAYERSLFANLLIFIMMFIHVAPLNLPAQTISIIYLSVSAFIMAVVYFSKSILSERLKYSLLLNSGLFIASSIIFSFYFNVSDQWGLIIWTSSSLLLVVLAYLLKVPRLTIISSLLISYAVWRYISSGNNFEEISIIFTCLAGIVLITRTLLKNTNKNPEMKKIMLANLGLFVLQSSFAAWSSQSIQAECLLLFINAMILYAYIYIDKFPTGIFAANLLMSAVIYNLPLITHNSVGVDNNLNLHMTLSAMISVLLFSMPYYGLRLYNKTKYSKPFMYSVLLITNFYCFVGLINSPTTVELLVFSIISLVSFLTLHYEAIKSKVIKYVFSSIIIENILLTSIFVNISILINQASIWTSIITATLSVLCFGLVYFILRMKKKLQYSKIYLYSTLLITNFYCFVGLVNGPSNPEFILLALISLLSVLALHYEGLISKIKKYIDVSIILENVLVIEIFYALGMLLNSDRSWAFTLSSAFTFVYFASIYVILKIRNQTFYSLFYLYPATIIPNWYYLVIILGANYSQDNQVILSGGIAVLSMACLLYEGLKSKKLSYVSVAIVSINLIVNLFIKYKYPQADLLVYSHLWALTSGILGVIYYYKFKKNKLAKQFLYGSISLITFPTGLMALGFPYKSDLPADIIFIIEQSLILLIGLAYKKKLISIWGAVSIVLAVVWMIRGYTVILLILLAALIMSGAIYGLLKISKKQKNQKDKTDDIID